LFEQHAILQYALAAGKIILLFRSIAGTLGQRERLLFEFAQTTPQGFMQ
jgi:hypothetical protein